MKNKKRKSGNKIRSPLKTAKTKLGAKKKMQNNAEKIKPDWLDFDRRGRVIPSRRKGSHGYYKAIFAEPTKLKKPNSYERRVLVVLADCEITSDEATQKFNSLYKGEIKRPTTQGSISAYFARLDTYGLVEKDTITKKYRLAQGVREILDDGEALYQRAEARRQYWLDRIKQSEDNGKVV